MDREKSSNIEPTTKNKGFETVADEAKKESWKDHVRRARELLFRSKHGGEEATDGVYRLTEHLPNPGKTRKDREWFKNAYESWDNCGVVMPEELGRMVEETIKDPKYYLGVHRSDAIDGANYENDETLKEIMWNGLLNFGDAASGNFDKNPDISKTVSLCKNMFDAVISLKGSYKGSTGAVLVKIPRECVNSDGEVLPGKFDNVYRRDEQGNAMIRPELLMGFVQNLGKGNIMQYSSREKLLEKYRENNIT